MAAAVGLPSRMGMRAVCCMALAGRRACRGASFFAQPVPARPLLAVAPTKSRIPRLRYFVVQATAASATDVTSPLAAQSLDSFTPPAWKVNFDYKFVRDNLDTIIENCRVRKTDANALRVVELYEQFVKQQQYADDLRARSNAVAAAMKSKLETEERQRLIQEGKDLKEQIKLADNDLTLIEGLLQREAQRLPNLTHPDAPLGGEEVAVVRSLVGSQRDFGFKPKDHVALGEALNLIDFESAAAVSGNKFYYLKNGLALMELALIQWAMSRAAASGFTPYITPDLVRDKVFEKCGFQPRSENTQVYSVADSDLCLAGTAEIPLGGLYMDEILTEPQLPIKMAAFGHCFRTEAGAAGAATRGLYRVHQFSKVEMFVICTPEQSNALHEELIALEESMYKELGLHYKTLDMPSEDLGAPAYRKYDVEAWMPGLGRYGEISSASNCTDYQARRLNIRYRPKSDDTSEESSALPQTGKKAKKNLQPPRYVHTLNATACAVPRMLIAIMENYQQADGTIDVPEVLRPFMGGISKLC
eukprot:jgi/Chlat1/7945/Chrsp68S07370